MILYLRINQKQSPKKPSEASKSIFAASTISPQQVALPLQHPVLLVWVCHIGLAHSTHLLVFTLANLFRVQCSTEELSKIARVGSGSACRSLAGGTHTEPQNLNSKDLLNGKLEIWPLVKIV